MTRGKIVLFVMFFSVMGFMTTLGTNTVFSQEGAGVWYRHCYGGATESSWQDWQRGGGIIEGNVSCVATDGGVVYEFVRGEDNGLWYYYFDQTGSGGGSGLGGQITGSPEAVIDQEDLIWVFAKDVNNSLWYRRGNQESWSNWQSLGGDLQGEPAAVVDETGNIYVFARGGDNQLWCNKYRDAEWSGWFGLGGQISDSPEGVVEKDGDVSVFVRGGDNGLYWRTFTLMEPPFGIWSDWQSAGGSVRGKPSAVAGYVTGGLLVFARGADDTLWCWRNNRTWEHVGGTMRDNPEAVVTCDPLGEWGGCYFMVFVRGADNRLWYRKCVGPWIEEWQSLGGHIAGSPSADAVHGYLGEEYFYRVWVFAKGG